MKTITNIQVLQYTHYYDTIYSLKIENGIQYPETKRLKYRKELSN